MVWCVEVVGFNLIKWLTPMVGSAISTQRMTMSNHDLVHRLETVMQLLDVDAPDVEELCREAAEEIELLRDELRRYEEQNEI